jgi:hypothetical protein
MIRTTAVNSYVIRTNLTTTRIWLPVGKSGYRPVTGNPEHPRETEMPNKKNSSFFEIFEY